MPDYLSAIRDVPDFPKPGIIFKDITPLLADVELFKSTMDEMAEAVRHLRPTHFAAIESRGFIFAGGGGLNWNLGFSSAIAATAAAYPYTPGCRQR